MSRKYRRNQKDRVGYILPIVGMCFLIVGLAFVSSFILFGNRMTNNNSSSNKIISSKIDNSSNLTNEQIAETGSKIGKTVDELTNSEENVDNKTEKRAINTSNVEAKILESRNENNNSIESSKNFDSSEESYSNEIKEESNSVSLKFERPVEGELLKDFSDENLVYSNTLNEWCTHLGIDYKAEKTSIVKAAQDGVIKSIKNDPRYGLTVVIKHEDGFETMYANLLSTEFITVGEKVEKGQTIATVGNTAAFEAADETHLHFELLKDGKSVNPNLYMN